MDVQLAEERSGDVLILLPVGRVDSTNAGTFETAVMDRIGAGERRLVIDFSRLDFISSSGLRVILLAAKALKVAQGALVLCRMKDHVHEVFRISGFDQIIPIKQTRDSALAAAD